jgi:hypothetical protein
MGLFSKRSAGHLVVAAGLALTLAGPCLAQSLGQEVTIGDQRQLVESLRSGGYVIVVRHGACPAPFEAPEKNPDRPGATNLTKVRSTQAHSSLECPE